MAAHVDTTPSPDGKSSPAKKVKDRRNRSTQILRLYHEHQSLKAASTVYCDANLDDPNLDEKMEELFFEKTDALEDELMALPSTCAADLAAKMLLAHRGGEDSLIHLDDPAWVEALALVNGEPGAPSGGEDKVRRETEAVDLLRDEIASLTAEDRSRLRRCLDYLERVEGPERETDAGGEAEPTSEVERLFYRWRAARAAWMVVPETPEEEKRYGSLIAASCDAQERVLAAPSVSERDVLLKVAALRENVLEPGGPIRLLVAEAERFVGGGTPGEGESIVALAGRLARDETGLGADATDADCEAAVADLTLRLMAQEPTTVADLARQVVWWQGLHDPADDGAGEFFQASPIMRERLRRLARLD